MTKSPGTKAEMVKVGATANGVEIADSATVAFIAGAADGIVRARVTGRDGNSLTGRLAA